MSKRSVMILVALAAIALGLAFYAKERQSRLPVHVAAATPARANAGVERKKENAAIDSPATSPAKNRFSEKEYQLLRQQYKPNMPQADGPMAATSLDMLARNTKSNTRDQKMWPVFEDVIYGKSAALENRLDTGLSANVTILLDYPYNTNVSLLDMAIKAGQRNIIQVLLDHGASVDQLTTLAPDGTPLEVEAPLPLAAGDGEDDVVRLLLQNGAYVDQRRGLQGNDQTALDAAVYSQNVSTAYLLLTHGADVNSALDPGGTIPALLLPSYASPRMVALRNLLVEDGAKMPSGQ